MVEQLEDERQTTWFEDEQKHGRADALQTRKRKDREECDEMGWSWTGTDEDEDEDGDENRENSKSKSTSLDEMTTYVGYDAHVDAMELRMLLEGEDAVNVEDLCDVFEELEDADEGVSHCQSKQQDEKDEPVLVSDEEEEENARDVGDAKAVDEMAALFGDLERDFHEEDRDWLAALDVDDMASTYTALLDEEEGHDICFANESSVMTPKVVDVKAEDKPRTTSMTVPAPSYTSHANLRAPLPSFTVRMEGAPTGLGAHALETGGFLAGPPVLSTARPLPHKHQPLALPLPSVLLPRVPDATLSQTRRECAAKRRRIKGRFTAEKVAFLPITALQP